MGFLVDVKNNQMYYSTGQKVDKISILVDEDVLLACGELNDIEYKYNLIINMLSTFGLNTDNLNVLTLEEKLPLEDCSFIIDYLLNHTNCNKVIEFTERFKNDNLYPWINELKEECHG